MKTILPPRFPRLSAAIALALVATTATAADWPQWRGPNRDDISPEGGLLKDWPADGPPLVWKAKGIGGGYSSVAVVGDKIFTLGDQADASYAYALNRATGTPVWNTKIGKAGAPGWGGFAGPRATPTVAGDSVYIIDKYGDIVCLRAKDGNEVWRKNLSKDFGGALPEWGFSESPLVDGDRVVFTPGGSAGAVVALNWKTGDLAWRCEEFKDAAHYSSVIVAEIAGVRQYIQLTDANVAGIRAKDGRLLWTAKRKGATAVIPTPIYADNCVFVTSGYGVGCNLFKIYKEGDKFETEQVYANKVMANHHGGVVKIGDYLYGYSEGKGLVCQNFKTGEMVWNEKERAAKGSVTFADGHLYCREEGGKGTVMLVEATPAGYRESGRFNPPDRSDKNSWAHPVVSSGKLYLRDQDVLLCYDVKQK